MVHWRTFPLAESTEPGGQCVEGSVSTGDARVHPLPVHGEPLELVRACSVLKVHASAFGSAIGAASRQLALLHVKLPVLQLEWPYTTKNDALLPSLGKCMQMRVMLPAIQDIHCLFLARHHQQHAIMQSRHIPTTLGGLTV